MTRPMTTPNRGGLVQFDEIADEILAELWGQTCAYRVARGEAPPPDHLRPHLADAEGTTR